MGKNEAQSEAVDIRTERLASQSLPSSTLVSQSGSAQAQRTEIVQVISTSGVSSLAGTSGKVLVNGGTSPVTGAVTLSLPATVNITTALQINGTQVVTARQTGWGASSGTLSRTAYATYAGQTVSGAYVQAEAQGTDDALKTLAQKVGALITDLRTHGLIGT